MGFILRIIVTPFDPLPFDYEKYRLPIAMGLSQGKGLYNGIHYNQMPIYPYLTGIMILLVGTESEILTPLAIKLPQVIADSFVPYFLYRIGYQLNQRKQGVVSSIIYALNPYSIFEIANATFHHIASLLALMALYYLLQQRTYLVGVLISLGFLVSQYPLIIMGLMIVYWRTNLLAMVKTSIGFILTTTLILGLVLIPFGTSLKQMSRDLSSHPVYTSEGYQNTIRDIITFVDFFYELSYDLWFQVWIIGFVTFMITPLVLYLRRPIEMKLIDVIVIQVTLLSIFFISNHTKHTLWLIPWVIYWSIGEKGWARITPFLIFFGYFLRRMQGMLPEKYLAGDIVLGLTGIWIIQRAIQKINYE
jgi:hypothetical protein